MTRVQIAARCLVSALLVYAGVMLPRPLTELVYYAAPPRAAMTLFLAVLNVALLVAAGWYFVVVSSRLLPGTTADDEILGPDRARRTLTGALVLTMVAMGLLLLPGSVPTLVAVLKAPFILRGAITEIIVDHDLPQFLRLTPARWLRSIYEIARLLLVLYLLCGAPKFVRRQTARARVAAGKSLDANERTSDE